MPDASSTKHIAKSIIDDLTDNFLALASFVFLYNKNFFSCHIPIGSTVNCRKKTKFITVKVSTKSFQLTVKMYETAKEYSIFMTVKIEIGIRDLLIADMASVTPVRLAMFNRS